MTCPVKGEAAHFLLLVPLTGPADEWNASVSF